MHMKGNLISRIMWECPHQFSWPRRDDSGGYYQLCVNCGTKYKYDWKHMRRTARVEDVPADTRHPQKHAKKTTWTPRERRLKHVVPVMYRVDGVGEWTPGESVNLSRSGLAFRTAFEVEEGSKIEIKLEMPRELTGDKAADVLCRATVARATHVPPSTKHSEAYLIGCSIEDYDFGRARPSSRRHVTQIDDFHRGRRA